MTEAPAQGGGCRLLGILNKLGMVVMGIKKGMEMGSAGSGLRRRVHHNAFSFKTSLKIRSTMPAIPTPKP